MSGDLWPLHTFRFELTFQPEPLSGSGPEEAPVDGAFSECTGLEATMEPKAIRVGGHNLGAVQRAGPVSFGTVVLKRGLSSGERLARWFMRVTSGDYGYRCTVRIRLKAPSENGGTQTVLTYKLERAMPVKFKAADFNARATDVGIEELHLVHEGLSLED
ncbi:phage tail protein [Myxococcus sp. AB056]|uniref:phage tail protein n=1 Tax=Myxococcus sp. AB056 TaxID=2562792 RepID=UPI0011478FB2|nr:phage tail protein [Myxococcus sp. AB056]